jgi:hypothetical protein
LKSGVEHARTERHFTVILRLPQPLSERSERKAAEDDEGSSDAQTLAEAQQRFVIHQISSILRL